MVVDKQIIAGCKDFDNKAQSELYNKYSSVMFGICLRYCRNYNEAEDLLQEGFITIFAKIGQYSGEGSFIGWMRKVMVNTILMDFRKKSNKIKMLEITDVNEAQISGNQINSDPEYNVHDVKSMIKQAQFSQEELLEVINNLPDGYRIVFNLRVIEGYKHNEIAEMLNVSESTSKSQLLRARQLLKKNLYELSLKKHSEKRKNKLAYAFAFLVMNEDLNYIDEILKKGFDNLNVTPSTGWTSIGEKLNQAGNNAGGNSTITGITHSITKISSNVISYISGNVFTVLSFLTASVISVGFITSSSSIATSDITYKTQNYVNENNQNENSNTAIINIPSNDIKNNLLTNDEPGFVNENNSENKINRILKVDTVTVQINKIIYKTEKQIIRDTIRIKKSIFSKE